MQYHKEKVLQLFPAVLSYIQRAAKIILYLKTLSENVIIYCSHSASHIQRPVPVCYDIKEILLSCLGAEHGLAAVVTYLVEG